VGVSGIMQSDGIQTRTAHQLNPGVGHAVGQQELAVRVAENQIIIF